MELVSVLRMMGGLGVVLGLLGVALWIVRHFDLKLPGRVLGGAERRIELVERLPLDKRRSVALIRRDGREHLVLLTPEGPQVIEAGIVRDAIDLAASEARVAIEEARQAEARANAAAARQSFGHMVERASGRLTRTRDTI
ncbi:flagellar biosynthetic protein FliO [Sphingomonas mucosissima]|uniref:Flagellar biosynthesis protein, FliO n=1 Tax=Sphingomonas mucosissima TaxID=370959 RepID=A0A245ZTN9_9SPHN|nr:flagellar biosynthetic protein FliO [Sphingomonas mucosissima]OWK33108.1 flagellar biosynthesis protein, FliO [Sphingomonas mucosissima]